MLWMWVSQPGSSTEQPNPQIPDITSFSRPGPTASPSPSSLPPLWGQGRDSERAGWPNLKKTTPPIRAPFQGRAQLVTPPTC